ncbi:MAG: hypothetical protein J6Y20_10020 [Lachnospiraceae bacterium]|nr:hypothetical protein [Lachnospiraceae bacterium]MBP5462449.1 hypothetical protein [Lachnospiraceae bacterium]
MKKYRLSVMEIDEETGSERELIKEDSNPLSGMTIMGDMYGEEGRGVVCIFHDNIANIASKIASEPKLLMAARFAVMMSDHANAELESDLLSSIMGGLQ